MLTITIPNWVKFNPRSDRANYTWFRLQNDFFHDQAVFALNDSCRCLYLFLLCEASKKNCGDITLSPSYIAAILGRKASEINKEIEILSSHKIIATKSRHDDGKEPSFIPATNERTNERTNEQTPDFDFESLYRKYPRKEGKTEGIKRCKSQIKTQEDFNALALAIENYKRRLTREGTEPKFIKHFSSFMSSWRDWIEKESTTFHGDQPVQPVYKPPEWIKEEPCDPERVRAIVSGVFGSMPKESA